MFTLMHPDVIRTQVFVPQDQAFGLGPGVDAVVRVPEIPDRTFPGKVTRIASALQPGSRTLLTEIDVPNPDWRAQSRDLLHRRTVYPAKDTVDDRYPPTPWYSIRTACMSRSSQNGTVHLQKITIARDFGTEVEVHDGVKPGDQVVLNPMVNLAEGSKVAVRKNKPQISQIGAEEGLAMRRLLFTSTAILLAGCSALPGASLHHGQHGHGPSIDARDDRQHPRSMARVRSRRQPSPALPTRRWRRCRWLLTRQRRGRS